VPRQDGLQRGGGSPGWVTFLVTCSAWSVLVESWLKLLKLYIGWRSFKIISTSLSHLKGLFHENFHLCFFAQTIFCGALTNFQNRILWKKFDFAKLFEFEIFPRCNVTVQKIFSAVCFCTALKNAQRYQLRCRKSFSALSRYSN